MFNFEFSLSVQDYIDFNIFHATHSNNGKKAIMIFRWSIVFIFAIFLLFTIFSSKDTFTKITTSAVYVIISVIWFFISKKIYLNIIKKSVNKLNKDGSLPFSEHAVLIFEEDSINEKSPTGEAKTNISAIEKVFITDTFIYFYFSSMQAYLLPMSVFSSEDEKTSFLEYCHQKFEGKIIS